MSTYTVIEPTTAKFFYNNKIVMQTFMDQYRLCIEFGDNVKLGIGTSLPEYSFQVNGNVFLKDLVNVDNSLSFIVTGPNYTQSPVYSFLPVGGITIWTANTVPTGWLECNGNDVYIIDYPNLYNIIGDTYTPISIISLNNTLPYASKVFRLPDFRGGIGVAGACPEYPVGSRYPSFNKNTQTYYDFIINLQQTKNFILQDQHIPPHSHYFTDNNKDNISWYQPHIHSHVYGVNRQTNRIPFDSCGKNALQISQNFNTTTTLTGISHSHTVIDIPLTNIVNSAINIEQQYIVLKYIIRAI